MKVIKTRDTVIGVRTLDRATNVAERMKNTYVRTKEHAELTQQINADSPTGYAEDRATESVQDVTNMVRNQGKRLAEKIRQQKSASSNGAGSTNNPHACERNPPDYKTHGRDFTRDSTYQRAERTVSNYANKEKKLGARTAERGVRQSAHASKKTVKTTARGSVKAAKRGVKTAKKTSRTAIKTMQTTVKTAAKTAQATARTAQRAAQAARTAAKAVAVTAKTIMKAITALTKAMIATVKGLVAAIAAGGWVAVVVIVVILLAAFILGSVFGIFASEKGYNGSPPMPEVVSQINADFSEKINSIIKDNPHDKLIIDNGGPATMVANWNEVLAVYDVLVATDSGNPMEVATLDDAKIDKLITVFWDMNHISYSLDEVEVGTDEETGESITETILTITVTYRTAEDMTKYYSLSAERAAQVRELLRSEYAELFQRLTGSYVDITLSAAEIATIIETLPDDLSEDRMEVVLTAYSLLGKVKYFWGGKSLVLGWDSHWGTPMKVTAVDSPTTGTVRPFGLDCSGFVDWVFYNANDGEYIIGHGGGATNQYGYCDAIAWSSAQPGDLAFYPDCEHVGIVVKNDAGTLTVIHCASGSNNIVITQHAAGNGFAFAGRPEVYDK